MKLPHALTSITNIFRYGDRVHPVRDWLAILTVTLVLVFASLFWNAFLFLRVVNGDFIGVTASSTPAVTNASLTEVHKVFDARAVEEQRYQSEYRFVDPSVPGS